MPILRILSINESMDLLVFKGPFTNSFNNSKSPNRNTMVINNHYEKQAYEEFRKFESKERHLEYLVGSKGFFGRKGTVIKAIRNLLPNRAPITTALLAFLSEQEHIPLSDELNDTIRSAFERIRNQEINDDDLGGAVQETLIAIDDELHENLEQKNFTRVLRLLSTYVVFAKDICDKELEDDLLDFRSHVLTSFFMHIDLSKDGVHTDGKMLYILGRIKTPERPQLVLLQRERDNRIRITAFRHIREACEAFGIDLGEAPRLLDSEVMIASDNGEGFTDFMLKVKKLSNENRDITKEILHMLNEEERYLPLLESDETTLNDEQAGEERPHCENPQ